MLAAALAQVPPTAGERARELATAFVDRVGPRPSESPAGDHAQRWVQQGLRDRGWVAKALPTWPGATWACQPGLTRPVVLFLAHTDTVEDSPGGNDNAAAVGVLLAAAELLRGVRTERTVCLAFPDAEEVGLRGSFALDRAVQGGLLGPLDQVMALDLVGVGTLTHSGLGPPFGHRRLRALLAAAPADVPWVYRAVSQAWPQRERSDHHAFNRRGVPASHLLARGPHGFDWHYHAPTDTPDRLEDATLQAAVEAVVGVARAPALPEEAPGSPAFVLPGLGVVVPGAVTWLGLALGAAGAVAGAGPWPGAREAGIGAGWFLARGAAATAAFGAGMAVAAAGRRLDLALADPVVLAAWAAYGAVALAWPVEPPPGVARALGALSALALVAAALAQGAPLLALPVAVAAVAVGASRWVPLAGLLAAWPALYLLRPDAIRELAFHGLVPASIPLWTALAGALLLPVLASVVEAPRPARTRVAGILAAVLAIALLYAWLLPEAVPPMATWR